jgi:ESS family glutamate:Na+ symporter
MNLWSTPISVGDFFIDFALLGSFLLFGSILQHRILWLRDNLVPANVVGGLLGLFIAMSSLTDYLISSERLGFYVYHLLALLFIALGLRSKKKGTGVQSLKIGLLFISTYLIQAIVGLLIAFSLIYTIYPDLFAGLGLLMPLAFGMNPGIAYSIGQNWEQFGFVHGGTVGLAFAAIGFAVAYTAGIVMVKKGLSERTSSVHHTEKEASQYVFISSDSKVLHLALIGFTYLLTIGMLYGIEVLLTMASLEHEITTLWSFHFIFAAIMALAVRGIVNLGGWQNWIVDEEMSNNGNIFMDFMVVASISAITIAVIQEYWLALLLMGSLVALTTWYFISWITIYLFKNQNLERKVAVFGNMTGTMQSALVLLRIIDPKHETTVSQELVYGSGLALVFGFPLLLIINAPVLYFQDVLIGFWAALAMITIYLVIIGLIIWRLRIR